MVSQERETGIRWQNQWGDFEGQGVPQDYKEAMTWYRKSAEQGVPRRCQIWGKVCHGQRVPQDDVYAHMWFNISINGKKGRQQIEISS